MILKGILDGISDGIKSVLCFTDRAYIKINGKAMSVKTVDVIWRSEILPYLIIRGKIKWIIKNRKITFATRKGRTYSFPF